MTIFTKGLSANISIQHQCSVGTLQVSNHLQFWQFSFLQVTVFSPNKFLFGGSQNISIYATNNLNAAENFCRSSVKFKH
jgi:hypothetical protein